MIKMLLTMVSCLLLPIFSFITVSENPNCKDKELADNAYRVKTVVLDAGHGGKDDGCTGSHSKEKDLALAITLELGSVIEAAYPSVKVIFTRTEDVFIPLHERAAIANINNADLFISIHCNALGKKLAYIEGTETFVLGGDDSEHNLEVAQRENKSILLEDNYQQHYEGFDPNSDEGHIFSSMFQNAYLDRSILLAEKIEKYVTTVGKRKSRGVRQARFVVLRETTMPSILIETGFLTNQKDEGFLNSKEGQVEMAAVIFKAFREYKTEVEQEAALLIASTTEQQRAAYPSKEVANSDESGEAESLMTETSTAIQKEVIESKATERASQPVLEADFPMLTNSENRQEKANLEALIAPAKIAEPTVIAIQKVSKIEKTPLPERKQVEEVVLSKTESEINVEQLAEPIKTAVVNKPTTISFKVQLAASLSEIDMTLPHWKTVPDLFVIKEKNLFKYLSGNYNTYEEAVNGRDVTTNQGFKGAFIVAYKDGNRISLQEAKKILDIP